ncbi:hypothetical protein DP61_5722 [Burkholderia pseudomallei]|nr:hypothetical protein DP61_5722 [Burkholderia pseudomallei]KGD27318.1 hypothetical protein DO70_5142 [Burkholderia pseudomallei]
MRTIATFPDLLDESVDLGMRDWRGVRPTVFQGLT